MENIPEEKIISGKNSVLELLLSGKEIDTLFISSVDENKKIFEYAACRDNDIGKRYFYLYDKHGKRNSSSNRQ